jgi:two-component sensor histidine kinase
VLSRAVPILDAQGNIREWFGAASDVTERRTAEEQQALLARELDHRAKNTLAVVLAALKLTRAQDVPSFVRIIEGRVGALARAHTLLAEGRWRGASLRTLVEAELAAFRPVPDPAEGQGEADRVSVEGPEVMLAPGAVQALSMAVHELATNATKHGALSALDGRLAVSWRLDPGAEALLLEWTERGGPPIEAEPTRRGFGTRVLQATIVDQLGGTAERRWEPEGLALRIAIPWARALKGGGDAA